MVTFVGEKAGEGAQGADPQLATATSADGCGAGGAPSVICTVAVADPAAFVAVIVYVTAPEPLSGAPLIAPVVVLKLIHSGFAGEICSGLVAPVSVVGAIGVMLEPGARNTKGPAG